MQLHKPTQIKFLVSPHVEFAVTRRAVELICDITILYKQKVTCICDDPVPNKEVTKTYLSTCIDEKLEI